MKIAMLHKWFVPWNGMCQVSRRLATGLAARGHRVAIVANAADIERSWVDDEFRVVPLEGSPVESLETLKGFLEDWRPDVFHSHDNLGLYAVPFDVPHVVTNHGHWPRSWFLGVRHLAQGLLVTPPRVLLMHAADVTVAVSEFSRDQLSPFGLSPRVIHNGIPQPAEAAPVAEAEPGQFLYVGRIDERKADHLPEIWEQITARADGSDPTLDVVGYPETERLVGELARLSGVTVHGTVEDVEGYYRNASLLLFPSRSEACPLTVLEAQAYGLPVVAFDVCSHRELVHDGETGRVVEAYDTGAFADAALDTAASRDPSMVDTCRRHIREQYTVEEMVDAYEAVYTSLGPA